MWNLSGAGIEPVSPVNVSVLSHVQLCATQWTVAFQAPLPMEFSEQEYWSGLPFPSPEDPPNPGIEPVSCLAARFFTTEPPEKPLKNTYMHKKIYKIY